MSIYFRYDIPSNESRVSTADRMSTCLARGWFLLSDSLRGSWHLTDLDILAWSWSTLVKPLFNFRWHSLLKLLHTWKIVYVITQSTIYRVLMYFLLLCNFKSRSHIQHVPINIFDYWPVLLAGQYGFYPATVFKALPCLTWPSQAV